MKSEFFKTKVDEIPKRKKQLDALEKEFEEM